MNLETDSKILARTIAGYDVFLMVDSFDIEYIQD
jgi:hypothetical protein